MTRITKWLLAMIPMLAMALMLFGCNHASPESPSPASYSVASSDDTGTEDAYCLNAGTCALDALMCCTHRVVTDARCATTHRCCRPLFSGCTLNASQCCSQHCINGFCQ